MRSAVLGGAAVMVVAATIVLIGQRRPEAPRAESAPVIVVERAGPAETPLPTTAPVKTATPIALPADAPPSMSQQRPLSDDVVPLVSHFDQQLRDRLVNERRENEWADRSEAFMQARYHDLKGIGAAGREVDIVCGTSICQVSGSLADMPNGTGAEVMDSVQSRALIDAMAAQGLEQATSTFGPGADGRDMFVIYYKRMPPRPRN